jgi:CHASE3 domain sensor protein
MRSIIRIVPALLVVTAVIVTLSASFDYRRQRDVSRTIYTRSVKKHDIVDSARKAIAALQGAEVSEQNYVLTGEAAYSEAYAGSVQDWQDEIGTLTLVVGHDPALPFVQDLSKTGDRTLKELALVVSLYDGGSRDKALDRIRHGAGFVYLDQARGIAGKILGLDDEPTTRINFAGTLVSFRHLAEAVAALFCLTLIGALLLIFQTR